MISEAWFKLKKQINTFNEFSLMQKKKKINLLRNSKTCTFQENK